MKKTYAQRKEEVRQQAIDWQWEVADNLGLSISYGDLAESQAYFEKMGRRYGLLEEFRENAIC